MRSGGRRLRRGTVVLAVTAVGLGLVIGEPARAATTFTVTSVLDRVDANVGDGVCLAAGGVCTLRAAVQEANSSTAADTVVVPQGTYTLTIAPSGGDGAESGDIDITRALTLHGAGAATTTIAARDVSRVLETADTAGRVTVRGFTLRDGFDGDTGGAVLSATAGTLRMEGVVVTASAATAYGGGIAAHTGRLDLVDTIVRGNATGGEGGGIHLQSGALSVSGASLVEDNTAREGGGVFHAGDDGMVASSVTVIGARIDGNTAEGLGGGASITGDGAAVFTDTVFADNTGDEGGGLAVTGLTSVAVTRGAFSANTAHGSGGGAYLATERAMRLTEVAVTENFAGDPAIGEGSGGGVAAGGTGALTVTGGRFDGNETVGFGGGLLLETGGPATVTGAVFDANRAGAGGGGIGNEGGRVTLSGLTITGNTADGDGGGIGSEGSGDFTLHQSAVHGNTAVNGGGFANGADGSASITASTFWDNRARVGSEPGDESGLGGGVFSLGDAAANYENVTIHGNHAQTRGGGFYVDADAPVHVTSSTISGNSAPTAAGVGTEVSVPPIPPQPSQGVILGNTIVAGNLVGSECNFAVGSLGGNLDSGDSCHFRGPRDRTGVGAPRVDAVADNGGPTMTQALWEDSFAVDGGVMPCPVADQRGVSRPRNGACDIGAYEHEGPFPAPDTTPPDTSLVDPPAQVGEYAVFRFAGTDNATPAAELLYECRILTTDPTEPPDPPDPTEPPDPEFAWLGCPNPYEVMAVEEGENTIEVRAVDRRGNVDPTPAAHTFIGGQDTTPPTVSFTRTPPEESAGRTTVFGFAATDDLTPAFLLETECRLDSTDENAWLECASPHSVSDLTTGEHTFEVRAVDAFDNVSAVAAHTWTVSSPTTCTDANVTLVADADAAVDESLSLENFGSLETMTVQSSQPGRDARALVRFAVPTDIPAACELVSAHLRLTGDGDHGRTLQAVAVTQAWTESQVTWQNQPTTGAVAATTASGAGQRQWDLTAPVAAMVDGGSNHGFLIRDAVEEDEAGASSTFASRHADQDPTQPATLPQLVLRFGGPGETDPGPPPAPVEANVTCGQIITASVRLLNSLTDCPADGLVVAAPNVHIDLNGHTVDGPGYFPGEPGSPIEVPEIGGPAGVRNLGFANVHVTNGTVKSFLYGVQFAAGSRFGLIEDLDIRRNATTGVELDDADNGRDGNVVRGNRFVDNELGLSVVGGTEVALVEDNRFEGNLGYAWWLQEASRSTFQDNDISGITADPLLSSDGGASITASPDNRFLRNQVRHTGDGGFVIRAGSHRLLIQDNLFSSVGDAGVSADGADFLEIIGNRSYQGSDAGIALGSGHGGVIRGNDVRFNPGGIALDSVTDMVVEDNLAGFAGGSGIALEGDSLGNVVRDNNVDGSAGSGISIAVDALDLDGNVIEGNQANSTLADGIETTGGGHTLRDNATHNNAAFGIQAADFTVDGGNNRASGNGEPTQCEGVVCVVTGPVAPIEPDITGPDTAFTLTPVPPSSTLATVRFEFTGSDNRTPAEALRFECRLDAPPDPPAPEPEPGEPPQPPDVDNWGECVSPTFFAYLPAGQHTFEVRSRDAADLVDLTPATFTWMVAPAPPGTDERPPQTRISSAPAAQSSDTTAVFGFRGTDNATPGPYLSYRCSLDGGAFEPCAPGVSHPGLALGAHTFAVVAVDLSGNVDPSPAEHAWTVVPPPVDTTAPDTVIADGPDPTTVSQEARFAFAADEAGTGFQCSLDGGPWTACTSSRTYTGIGVGQHTFSVRAVDAAGNADPSPAAYAWTVGAPPVPMALTCGQVVTQSVRATEDLLDCPADGVVVGANGITVDLGGVTIDGVGQGVGVRNDGFDSVTVTNGTVQQFDTGVLLGSGTALGIVSGVTAQLNQEAGIALTDADNGVTGSTARSNQLSGNAYGIVVDGGTQGAVVLDNSVGTTAEDAISVLGSSGVRLERNTVATTGGRGIVLDAAPNNSVLGNTVSGTSKSAVVLGAGSDGNRVEGNALDSGEIGIEVLESHGNQVLANTASGMNGPGVGLDGANDNQVVGNELTSNKDGIEAYASSRNRVEGNNASGNSSAGIAIGDGSLDNAVTANQVNQNDSEGISVEAEALTGPGNRIAQNTASGNSGDGIAVNKAGHTILANTANNNDGWGVYAEAGNTDGGGNRATGNAEPTQCQNIVCDGGSPQGPEVNPPDTVLVTMPPNPSGSTSASFTFTGVDDNTPLFELEFQCSLDGAPVADCENPHTYSALSPGQHRFEVAAVDLAGKVDPTPAVHVWNVVLPPVGVPPDTTITSGPAAQTPLPDAVIAFTSNEPDTRFQCSLDGGAFTACTSPAVFEEVQFGTHTFAVRAVDPEGNVDPTPATRTWTRVGPPVVTVTSGPGEITTARRAEFTFVANEPVLRFECSLDLAPYTACASPVEYTGLAIGEHTLRVRAVDLDGMVSDEEQLALSEWTVEPGIDTVPPSTAFTALPTATEATFAFTGADDVTSPDGLLFECRLDSDAEADFAECASPYTYPNPDFPDPLAPGSHTVDVRAVDMEDNIDPTPARHTWTYTGDTTAPAVAMGTTPPASTPAALARFTFTANDPYAVFECSVDALPHEECSSPFEVAVEPGAHTVAVRARDLSGNVGTPVTTSWTVVETPVVAVLSAPAPTVTDPVAVFAFSSSVAGSQFACSLDGAAFSTCASPVTYSGLAVGAHSFSVRALAAGATGETVHHQWTVAPPPDTVAPETTVVTGPPSTTTDTSAQLVFTSSETGTFACSLDGAAFTACASPLSLTGLSVGQHELRVRSTDEAGNTDASPAVHTWTVQEQAPPAPTCPTAPITLGANRDAWVASGQSNKGTDSVLKVSGSSRALVRFELPALPDGCAVAEAQLRLHAGSHASGRTLQALRVAATWTENGVTWSNQPGTTGPAVSTTSGSGYRSWSVAEQVNAMYAGANHGFLVRDANTGSAEQSFHSREKGADNPPRLVLTLGPVGSQPPADTTAPDTAITTAPPASTTAPTAQFAFTATEPGTFACSLDGAPFTACASPVSLSGLGAGQHEFRVAATDAAGNTDATPAAHTWAVTGSCTAPGTVTVGANADSWLLQSSSSSNYGSDSVLKVDSKSGNNARALVRFALPTLPAGCSVTGATLRLHSSSHKDGRTLQALQVTSAWTEGDVRWNNQPATGTVAATAASGSGYRSWSVAQQVTAMYTGANHGFLIRDAAEGGSGVEQGFHSREKGSDNPPRLVLTFG
jgi:CSLREA domain-containing protein